MTFTVSCEDACLVAIANADGNYTRVACTTTEGVHRFTVTIVDADVDIALAIVGDADLNGIVNTRDSAKVSKAVVGAISLSGLYVVVSDVNGDGNVNTRDAAMVSKMVVGAISADWK